MSSGLSPMLPLNTSDVFGAYNLNTSFNQVALQNLKMLVLTAPGERIMDPNFGVGLRNYLFEFNEQATYSAISSKILSQVRTYLPYLRIDDIKFKIPESNPDLYPHTLSVDIAFTIKPLQIMENLSVSVDSI
tara:strand:+ start:16921 stop:17316 length:396 start_codon:yes stop_codon:yes gene_type:complete